MNNRVTRRAGQPGVSFRSVYLFLDGTIETPVEKDRMIMATGAPLAGLGSDDRLHVLDRLPVELIVERREVVDRTLPLLVDILVALPAFLRVHEEVSGN